MTITEKIYDLTTISPQSKTIIENVSEIIIVGGKLEFDDEKGIERSIKINLARQVIRIEP